MKKYFFALLVVSLLLNSFVSYAFDTEELESEALEKAENAVEITEGDFYDSVISVWPDITTVMDYQDGSCTVDVVNLGDSIDDIVTTYLWICARMADCTNFYADYDSISVSYLDENVVSLMRIYDYENAGDFKTSLVCISAGDDGTEYAALSLMYKFLFYNYDYATKLAVDLNDALGEDFQEIEERTNDYVWLWSSFPVNVPSKIEDNMAVINYKNNGYTDSYETGYLIWKEINHAAANYKRMATVGAGLSFDTIDIICYDDDGNKLLSLDMTIQPDGSWENNILNYWGNDEFYSGVEGYANSN